MIKSDAKVLHSFRLADFSGGINTDTPGIDKELIQCLNGIIDSKGYIDVRGGSKLLNVDAPIGYQAKEVWGYLLGCDENENEYTSNFLTGGAISASAYTDDADHVLDEDEDTYWQAYDDFEWSTSYDSAATIIYCQIKYLNKIYAGGNDGNIYVCNEGSWSLAYNSDSAAIRSLCVFNGKLYAGATAASAAVGQNLIYSFDGTTWSVVYVIPATISGNAFNTGYIPSVTSLAVYGANLIAAIDYFVYVALDFCQIFSSSNGTSWSLIHYSSDGSFNVLNWCRPETAVVFGDNLYFAGRQAGSATRVIRKYNGTTFTEVHADTDGYFFHTLYVWNDGIYAGGGTGGKIYSSADGTTWNEVEDLGTGSTYAFAEYGDYLLASYDEKIYRTANGTDWELFYTSVSTAIYSMYVFQWTVFHDESLFVGVGNTGIIYAYENAVSYTDGWLKYTLAVAKTARKLAITPYNSGVRLFTLYGSNDDIDYTSIYSSVCDAGNTRQEFTFANATAYLYYKLMINTAYGSYFISVAEWELMELTESADMNYYIFDQTPKDIIRKVIFPTLNSMLNFVTYWKAKNLNWEDTYYCTATDFDIEDNGDISEKVIAEGEFTIANFSEAILDGKINEWMSVFSLLQEEENNEMFGIPQAWQVTIDNSGITSMHELKRRNLRQTYSYDEETGIFSAADFEPKEYIQNKFVFVTADNAILTCNIADDLTISGFNVLATGLKRNQKPSWRNFQNRAFMVNGCADDCDLLWTDGEQVGNIGIAAPIVVPVLSSSPADGGYMSDGTYYFKYAYHRTTYGTNEGNLSPELAVTLDGGTDTQSVILTVMPSSDPQVDKIYLYRSKKDDYLFYYCASIDNVYDANDAEATLNITATLNDNSLFVGDLHSDDNDLPPNAKFIEVGGERMWYATNSGVYYSKKGFPEKVPITNYIGVSEDDGELIMGMLLTTTWLIVWKETKTYAIDVNNPDSREAILISDTLGMTDNNTARNIEGEAAIWCSQLGFCITDGVNVVLITKGRADESGGVTGKIFNDFVKGYDHSRKDETYGIYYPKRQQYWCYTPYIGGYYRIWIYDIQGKIFYKHIFPIEPKNFFLLTDSNNVQRLISTFTQVETEKYYGYIVVYDEDDFYDTSAITLAGVETRDDISMDVILTWNSFNLAERIKSFRHIYAELYASAATTATISCGIDHKRKERREIPLSGSINTTASVNVVGVGTYFLTELLSGDYIVVGDETRIVDTITDDTHLTVTVAFTDQPNDTSPVKLSSGIHSATITHPGEVGTAPTAGKDEIEGFDYGRIRSIQSPVNGVGTYFSIRFQHTGHVMIRLFGFTILFRLKGARP